MKKICYKKLWKLLIDKDLKKKDLCLMTSISPASMARMTRNKNVSTEQLVKICTALDCGLSDIVEVVE
ncbi:MAG: helix-turn-helix transcriptional regulator [Selenomonadaceae bacterium]|nr:helix-turn-helix transcriptional regulator [Selenomonadaceae bacterium]